MSHGIQSETDVQEIFYNLLLDAALTEKQDIRPSYSSIDLNDPTFIRYLIKKVLKTTCTHMNLLATSKGVQITAQNVPASYSDLFKALTNLQEFSTHGYNPEYLDQYYETVITEIEKRQTFNPMVEKIRKFFHECMKPNTRSSSRADSSIQGAVNVDTIRQTFYNIMAEMTILSGLIPKEDLISQDSYIFFGLSSFAIIESVLNSKGCPGIRLFNGGIVISTNCPPGYKDLFDVLMKLKMSMTSRNLSEQQIRYIRIKALQNPDMQTMVQEELTEEQKRQVKDLVTMITDISINISQIGHFKEIIDDVIKFCISAL